MTMLYRLDCRLINELVQSVIYYAKMCCLEDESYDFSWVRCIGVGEGIRNYVKIVYR